MGREIKFRAWIEGRKEMLSPYFFVNDENFITQYGSCKPSHVMQFTGVDDNNGKNLYEGDIIKSKCYPFYSDAPELHDGKDNPVKLNYLGVVGIDVDGVYYDLKVVSNRVSGRATGGNISDLETFEIIGNIYENPELLKVNK